MKLLKNTPAPNATNLNSMQKNKLFLLPKNLESSLNRQNTQELVLMKFKKNSIKLLETWA